MHDSFRKFNPLRDITNVDTPVKPIIENISDFKTSFKASYSTFEVPTTHFINKEMSLMKTIDSCTKTQSDRVQMMKILPFKSDSRRTRVRIGKLRHEKVDSKRIIFKNKSVTISFEIVNLIN